MSMMRQDMLPEGTPPLQRSWAAEIQKTVTDITAMAFVLIPDYTDHLVWGPCRWQSRDAVSLPQKGDPCVVVFDSRNEPWIIAWWPY